MHLRTAVVTGASGDIGRAIAARLAAGGHRVVLVARRRDALEAAAASIGEAALVLAADVTDPAWTDALGEAAPEIDVVVHAAAAYAPFGLLEATTPDDDARVFAVGPLAAARLVRAALPGMKARGFGRVVLIGSLVGAIGGHGQAAYASAKAALSGLARSVALEGGARGVTANVVELGLVDTARVRAAVGAEAIARLMRATPVGRAGAPSEVAAAVSFLCSGEAALVTGAVLPMTGGLGLGLPR
ncbi:MAG TPA: SDR family oxidoreductase [Byssovorax sp.]|jgi:NAD(P)-dependent dehydrogenase (short-subunit alcohol dehydrogenase family)